MLDNNQKCVKCHDTCKMCSDCKCVGDLMYNYISDTIGCVDCSYFVSNC